MVIFHIAHPKTDHLCITGRPLAAIVLCYMRILYADENGDFTIVYQSDRDIKVSSFQKAIPLIYIASPRGIDGCNYCWHKLGEPSRNFPNSPAVFVNKIGLYKCDVEFRAMRLSSAVISITVTIGVNTQV